MKFFGKRALIFAGGLLAGAAAKKVLENGTIRNLAVEGVAKGMKLKKSTQATLENLKEDAQDIRYDASRKVEEEEKVEEIEKFEKEIEEIKESIKEEKKEEK